MDERPYAIGSEQWPGLAKMAEEAGELTQVVGKLIAAGGADRHYDGSDLRRRLADECGDVLAAVRFFAEANGLTEEVEARAAAKTDTFRRWHARRG
ncbi:MazG nucleotide pyrophosphohydrolase domain-containing protein [Dactylosporangium sp. AC04546]|uniref:MazG nucleotide pyrophosphohydrolase domain-containing protein n=1 Tax=Dactylosporangium sp. AC04546 TaxID=2862460 RepID=UPI001EDDB770|nr:MazG nucleotide pyrophosphohydrolase domain-containing protein [Dactylosporangium sp. AC04546]WVK79690.1 MazG nucleotide pyrophosphohydrolase domain-containing protein [Dactylosporangium sp. AC04546]